jgi:hypothetical protein
VKRWSVIVFVLALLGIGFWFWKSRNRDFHHPALGAAAPNDPFRSSQARPVTGMPAASPTSPSPNALPGENSRRTARTIDQINQINKLNERQREKQPSSENKN